LGISPKSNKKIKTEKISKTIGSLVFKKELHLWTQPIWKVMDEPRNGHGAPSMGKIQFPNEIPHSSLGKIIKIQGKAQKTYKNSRRCLLITMWTSC